MNYNTDGFNDRSIYIHNNVDKNKAKTTFDNSFAKMRSEERKPDIITANHDRVIECESAKGNKENFVVMNNALRNIQNNMKNNMFKK